MGSLVKYTETKIYTTTTGVEPVTALLLRHGITGVSVEDISDIIGIIEGKSPACWDYVDPDLIRGGLMGGAAPGEAVVTFYTEANEDGEALLGKIKVDILKLKGDEGYGIFGAKADFGRLYAESTPLDDDWKEKWKEGFKPFAITGELAVRPPWEEYEPAAGGRVMVIDPGMAFGTGSHETTAMCAEAIEKRVRPGDSVLDVGTGSGILSIAAVILGAGRVDAVEIDEDAALSAAGNFKRNGVTESIRLIRRDIRDYREACRGKALSFDIIVANLTGNLVIEILPALKGLLKKDGKIIISGLLAEEEDRISRATGACGLTLEEVNRRGEWIMVCAGSS